MLGKFSGGRLTYSGLAGFPTPLRLHPGGGGCSCAGATHRLINQALSYVHERALLGLADRSQMTQRIPGTTPGPSPDETNRLIDHRSDQQRSLKTRGQYVRPCEGSHRQDRTDRIPLPSQPYFGVSSASATSATRFARTVTDTGTVDRPPIEGPLTWQTNPLVNP